MDKKPTTIIVSDRSRAAFLLAHRFPMKYISNAGRVDFVFDWSPELDQAITDYNHNRLVPVQDFLAAQREIADAIRSARQQWERGL